MNSILNIYCTATHLNRNLWMLERIAALLQEVENNSRKPVDCVTLLCKLVSSINKIPARSFSIPYENIQHCAYSTMPCDPKMQFMQSLVAAEFTSYFSVMFDNIKQSADVIQTLQICQHLLSQNCSKSRDLDSFDCMFIFIIQTCDALNIDNKVKQYITCAKDIFYYRMKKKDKQHRINLIYYALYVLVSKKVTNKAISSSSHDYLLVVPKLHQPTKPRHHVPITEQSVKTINVESDQFPNQAVKIILS